MTSSSLPRTHPYPMNVVRIMGGQIENLRQIVRFHFNRRHTTHTPAGVRNWIAELRRVDRSSGYSECVRQLNDAKFPSYRPHIQALVD